MNQESNKILRGIEESLARIAEALEQQVYFDPSTKSEVTPLMLDMMDKNKEKLEKAMKNGSGGGISALDNEHGVFLRDKKNGN